MSRWCSNCQSTEPSEYGWFQCPVCRDWICAEDWDDLESSGCMIHERSNLPDGSTWVCADCCDKYCQRGYCAECDDCDEKLYDCECDDEDDDDG